MPHEARYDTFLSHNSKDKAEVEEIALWLMRHSVRVWLDSWHLRIGQNLTEELFQRVMPHCATCVAFWGPHGAGPFQWDELHSQHTSHMRLLWVVLPGGDTNKLPISANQTMYLNLNEGERETNLKRLLAGILDPFPHRMAGPPAGALELPTVFLALSRSDFDTLSPRALAPITAQCTRFGMPHDPESFKTTLRDRYGDDPMDFAPFDRPRPLLATVLDAVYHLNLARQTTNQAPIWCQWMNQKLFSEDQDTRDDARDTWNGAPATLLILDALAIHAPHIQQKLNRLTIQRGRTCVQWIPPYARVTDLRENIPDLGGAFAELRDQYRHWASPKGLSKHLFDLTSDPGAWHWTFRTLRDLEPKAHESRIQQAHRAFQQSFPTNADF